MAFSFAELLKKQFPLAELGVDTRSSNRMPESSPFPSESALSAFGTGGLIDALSGVSMADYFNNDNYEMRPTEASPKRGEDVLRPYRMNPGDKTTIKVGNDGKIVETTERTTGDLFSEQPNRSDYPVQASLPSQRGSEFDPRMSGDLFPQQPNRSINSIASNNPYTGTPYIPIDPMSGRPFNNVDSMGGQGYIPNNVDLMGGQGSVANLNNTVYPKPTTRSMYNRPNEYQRMASMPTSFDGPGIRAQPVQPGMQNDINGMMMSNDLSRMIPPSLLDTAQSEMNRMPTLVAQGEDGAFPPIGPNVYGLDEGMFDEDPDDERRRLLGELLRQYYQKNPRTYT